MNTMEASKTGTEATYIGILGLFLSIDKSQSFLVPWSIIHYKDIMFSLEVLV